jgi:hypothetical protein
MLANTGGELVVLGSNVYINSAGTNSYIIGGNVATQYLQAGGLHAWYTTGTTTGAADSAITLFTQAMTLTAAGNLGIGTTSPSGRLHINDSAIFRSATDYVSNTYEAVFSETTTGGSGTYPFNANGHLVIQPRTSTGNARDIVFATGSNTPSTRMVITSDGYLRMASGSGGIQFNGDTAAANALDDYEQGTWTPSLTGSTSGSATSGGNTYGHYTKIGQLVTLNFVITISAVDTLTGNVKLSGLPFNLAGSGAFENRYPQGSVGFAALSTSWSSVLIGSDGGTTTLAFIGIKTAATATISMAAADLSATTALYGSIQYIA